MPILGLICSLVEIIAEKCFSLIRDGFSQDSFTDLENRIKQLSSDIDSYAAESVEYGTVWV